MKRLLCLFAALLLLFTSVPLTAHAAESEVICIGGTDVTSENAADIFGDGTARYDGKSRTLFLNGAKIEGAPIPDDNGGTVCCGIYIESEAPVRIQTEQTSSIVCRDTGTSCGIFCMGAITLGGGVLSISLAKCAVAYGIYAAQSITFDGAGASVDASAATDRGVAAQSPGDITLLDSDCWLYGSTAAVNAGGALNLASGVHYMGREDSYSYLITLRDVPPDGDTTPSDSDTDGGTPTDDTEKDIKKTDTDKKEVTGAAFRPLMLRAKAKKHAIALSWKQVKGADGYIVYGAKCGKKMAQLKVLGSKKKTSYTVKELDSGKYFKFVVVAYKNTKKGAKTVATSLSVHCATAGGKKGNPTGIKISKTKLTLKKDKTKALKPKLLSKKKVATHIAKFRYESSNPKVVSVTKKGKLRAKKKGTATIYIIAQNGKYKKIKVTVK